jgi:transcriptional regulator with XRE-family HTH domain
MSTKPPTEADGTVAPLPTPQQELARKLNLLLDVVVAEGNTPYTYREIAAGLKAKKVSLSRARWQYMIRGEGPLVSDVRLLTEIANFFGIAPEYLLGSDDDLPERIDSQLELVRMIRTLGDTSPEALREMTKLLENGLPGGSESTEK